ncbi:MAG: helical backbone metal receptor [Elusimicrobiota bacterium]|nr:helical backbone metal receptor [Elusimicrobiota bacterium]
MNNPNAFSNNMKKMLLSLTLIIVFISFAFAKDYKRIISLSPSATNALYELGIDKEIIAVTIFCPKGEYEKEIIGTLLEPDLEKIIKLKPDFIVASKDGNSKDFVEKLIKMKFTVYVMQENPDFEKICSNFNDLAKETGKQKEAEKIINQSKADISAVFEKTKNSEKKKVFWEIGSVPLYTCGKKSFLNDYNHWTNTKNIYEDLDVNYSPIDIEDVFFRNPQIIVIVSMDENKSALKNWNKFKSISAVKNDKIFIVSPYDLFGLTPLKFAQSVKLLYGLFYE